MFFLLPKSFLRDLKRFEKKFPLVRSDVFTALQQFDWRREISLGKGVYKIRIPSSDMKKGKSGSFRAYVYLKKTKDILVPLCLYLKSERESISQGEMITLLQAAQMEFAFSV